MNSPRGQAILQMFKGRMEKQYPELLEEMSGLASGANVPLDAVMLLNAMEEFSSLSEGGATPARDTSHCTDVFANSAESPCFGHNEDDDEELRDFSVIINATIFVNSSVVERYYAWALVGTMGGDCFGWNMHGMVFSENSLYPPKLNYADAVPCTVKSRALYRAHNFAELMGLHTLGPRVSAGFSFNAASTTPDPRTGSYVITNFEEAPLSSTCVHRVEAELAKPFNSEEAAPFWYSHVNMYQCLPIGETHPSSSHRHKRLEELGRLHAPRTPADVRRMLGDTADKEYPIYRNASAPDDSATLGTAIFDLKKRTAQIFTVNPGPEDATPSLVLPLW